MNCDVGHRCGSDLALLRLWRRLLARVPIGHLAWEPPYATGTALQRQKEKKKHNFSEFYIKFQGNELNHRSRKGIF